MWNYIITVLIIVCVFSRGHASVPWPPKSAHIVQKVDHFNYPDHNLTYKMRFLYEDRWYKNNKGPIFFYCGNEGPIESFWNNSGYIFELAKKMKAFVVFGEHRYYGESLPFPKAFQQPYIRYLSISQAMADYAYLLRAIQEKVARKDIPVIAFGGSYGGMLAAYMRVRYPHIVTGAVASSAPVISVAGLGKFHEFFEAVTNDFKTAKPSCDQRIREAYSLLNQMARDSSKWKSLSKQLGLCHPLNNTADFQWMLKWTRNAFVMMAMMDYPYRTSFMASLPAYPVNVSCSRALAAPDVISALREAVGVFYNESGALSCFDFKTQFIECADITGCGLGNDSLAWDFQSCTEINLHDDSGTTEKDMFPSLPLTQRMVTDYCQSRWGVTPAFDRLASDFGPETWKFTSNILFVNGDLDPWMPGGILKDISPTVKSIVLHGGAHHLDLRSPNPNDPPSARVVRDAIAENIKRWLKTK